MTSTPRYVGGGDPARRRTDYYPGWLGILAGDVTLEASAMDGAVGYNPHHRGPKTAANGLASPLDRPRPRCG
jgi:hypothetical protein